MDPATLAKIAAACQIQMNRDFAAHWGGAYRVRAGASSLDVQPGEVVFALLSSLPSVPGAIAYHDVNGNGVPVAYDAISLSFSLIGAGNSVSVAISHEILELSADPPCNRWADAGDNTERAIEVGDPVEAQSYAIDDTGVSVSNFVTPSWFDPGSTGPFDFMSSVGLNVNAPSGPFMAAPGGYQIERTSGTGEHQVTARRASMATSLRRPWRLESRRARRGVRS